MSLAQPTPKLPPSAVVQAAILAPSADNSQPWIFERHGTLLRGRYQHPGRGADLFGPLGHASLLSAGCMHENLSQLFGPAVSATLAPARADVPWQIQVDLARCGYIDVPRWRAIEQRHTNRHPHTTLSAAPMLPPPQAGIRVHSLDQRADIGVLADALHTCSRARFNQPELHAGLFQSLRWTAEQAGCGDGLDLGTLHLPSGGTTFMTWLRCWTRMRLFNRLGADRVMAAVDARMVRRAPLILALSGPRAYQAAWDAGRSLQRLWIELNAQGLAVHPYYALTDLDQRQRQGLLVARWDARVRQAVEQAEHRLGLRSGEQIHMLLRVGRPTRTPVRAQRRPAQSFLHA